MPDISYLFIFCVQQNNDLTAQKVPIALAYQIYYIGLALKLQFAAITYKNRLAKQTTYT